MDLSGIIWDLLKDQAMKVISEKTGLDLDTSKDLAKKALPMLLWALKNNSEDSDRKESLEKAVEWNDGSLLDNLDNLDLKDWGKILGHIFGDKKEEVEKEVWDSSILSALAPFVMWALWKANSDSGSSAKDLLSGNSTIMKIATSFLDKDWDGSITDDLMWMAMKKFM